jgi:hypothetical protein
MIFFLGLSLVLKNFTILLLSVYWDPGQGEYLYLLLGFFTVRPVRGAVRLPGITSSRFAV